MEHPLQKAFERAYFIKGACEGLFTVTECADRLKVTPQRVKQLKRAYRTKGAAAFVHGNKGRTPAKAVPELIKKRIIELKQSEKYRDANFAHFTELLADHEGISYGKTTISGILKNAGIQSPKKRRSKKLKQAHPPRPRRDCFGELLQADASPFDWFSNGEKYSLHGYQDDATGKITGLYLCKNECLLGYLEVTRQTLEKHGIPLNLYPDRVGVFFVNRKDKEKISIEEQLEGKTEAKTQMGQILDELDVTLFPAGSPEAKGRIERLWQTLQGRLPTEFRIRGIKTPEEANTFLQTTYIDTFNKQFSVTPAKDENRFVPLQDTSFLDTLLTARVERKTNGQGVFSFENYKFIIDAPECRNKKITIVMSEKIGIKAMLGKSFYDIRFCDFYDNRHLHTHMPEVTQILMDKYLRTNAKKDSKAS